MIKKLTLCCQKLETLVNNKKTDIKYNSIKRFYYLAPPRDSAWQQLFYCPFCGKQFLADLTEIYDDLIKNKFGIDEFDYNTKKENLPYEYQTDKWWQRRVDLNFKNKPLELKKEAMHCCEVMKHCLGDVRMDLRYDQTLHAYFLIPPKYNDFIQLSYCPWCSVKL